MAEASLRDRRRDLLNRPTLQGGAFCAAYADAADGWLSAVADRAGGGRRRHLALVAVGGYGRRELCPFSDLDLLLVHEGRDDVSGVAEAIWYPVWDEGVHLDHSVRRPAEVLRTAAQDLRVALGLLDARLVWGDARVAEPLVARARANWHDERASPWMEVLESQMAERRAAHGDVAYVLEPDLKEGHGGLRDIHVLHAVAAHAPQLADFVDLSPLDGARDLLLAARVELHRGAGRALDRLLLQEQDRVAETLGYRDADALMQAVAAAGRAVAWACTGTWQRRSLWRPTSRAGRRAGRRHGALPTPVAVEPGVIVLAGQVALDDDAPVTTDSSLGLRLAGVAATRRLPIARGALRRLADAAPTPPHPWPVETRAALVGVLEHGHDAIEPLEALNQEGLLSRLIPEWEAVRDRPQRNAYHRFTVDRHLLEAAANARVSAVERPDLLVVGCLMHDIGKGYPGDHTEAGTALVAAIAPRMGFSAADSATLVSLCQHHLLLADTATRRDLDDPATIAAVAAAVGDSATLHLLAELTRADGLATGPAAWGPWKEGLVDDLVARVDGFLSGRAVAGAARGSSDGELVTEVRATGRPVVRFDPPSVTVAAPDRRGLLASVAGTLALHGLDVRSADVRNVEGVAVEDFVAEVARGGWPDSERLRRDLDAVLAGELVLTDRLAAKAHDYAAATRPWSPHPVVAAVSVEQGASAASTVLEVRAADDVGLLHRVTLALFSLGLDVVSARVATIGDTVVDAFYLRDRTGAKIADTDVLAALEAAVLEAVRPARHGN